MTTDALRALRDAFPAFARWAYLDFAGVAPLPQACVDAMAHQAARMATDGVVAADAAADDVEAVRAAAAAFVGATTDTICFVRHTTEGLGWVANGLGLAAGDRVVLAGGEFPSSHYPWTTLRDLGITVDLVAPVPHPDTGEATWPVDAFAAVIADGPPPAVVSTSWVQYSNGYRVDVDALGRVVHDAGALFCVDMIQACGVVPMQLASSPVDFAVADGHKWMCAPEGVGIMYVARHAVDRLRPLEPGWNSVAHRMEWENLDWVPDRSARVFEGGSNNSVGIAGLGASIGLLSAVGADAVWRRVQELGDAVCDGVAARGCTVVSDRSDAHRSGSVVFRHPTRTPGEIVEAARTAGVVVSGPRAGGVRVSPHACCDESDVARLLELL